MLVGLVRRASPEHRGKLDIVRRQEVVFPVHIVLVKIPHGRRLALKGVPLGWGQLPPFAASALGGEPDKGDDQGEAEAEKPPLPAAGKQEE